jgi:hypothetical protein
MSVWDVFKFRHFKKASEYFGKENWRDLTEWQWIVYFAYETRRNELEAEAYKDGDKKKTSKKFVDPNFEEKVKKIKEMQMKKKSNT